MIFKNTLWLPLKLARAVSKIGGKTCLLAGMTGTQSFVMPSWCWRWCTQLGWKPWKRWDSMTTSPSPQMLKLILSLILTGWFVFPWLHVEKVKVKIVVSPWRNSYYWLLWRASNNFYNNEQFSALKEYLSGLSANIGRGFFLFSVITFWDSWWRKDPKVIFRDGCITQKMRASG